MGAYTFGDSDAIRQYLKNVDATVIPENSATPGVPDMVFADQEATRALRAALPHRYRELLDGTVRDEVLVWNATSGQTSAQLGRPDGNSGLLCFLNPPVGFDVLHAHSGSDYYLSGVSVDGAGAVTLPALAEGDRVVCRYTYTCSMAQSNVPGVIQSLWARLGALALVEAIYPTGSPVGLLDAQTLEQLRDGVRQDLDALGKPMDKGGTAIPEFDDLELFADHPPGDPATVEHWGSSEVRY